MMKKEKLSLVFFGSGPVASNSLKLLQNYFYIESIITKPSTVAEMVKFCDKSKIFSINNKLELDELFTTQNFQSDVALLIDFGVIVSKKVIDYFPKGIVNSHFSLLPELRGADPISFAILEGKNKTGVSLMLLVEAMDEGPIISVGEHELNGSETTAELTDSLVQLSFDLLIKALPRYIDGDIAPSPQILIENKFGRSPSYTRKLKKEDGIIDWEKTAEQIEREIRAFLEWPKSRTTLGGIEVIITKSYALPTSIKEGKPGDIEIQDNTKTLVVNCGVGSLFIEKLKPIGKKEMDTKAFLAGYKNKLIA